MFSVKYELLDYIHQRIYEEGYKEGYKACRNEIIEEKEILNERNY